MRTNTSRSVINRAIANNTSSRSYRIKAGDNIDSIARQFGISRNLLIQANRGKRVRIGVVLSIPQGRTAPANSNTEVKTGIYAVQNGDTLEKIARRSGISKRHLLVMNNFRLQMRPGTRYRAPLFNARNAGNAARNVPPRTTIPRRTRTSVRSTNVLGKSAAAPYGRYAPYSKEAVQLIQKSAITAGLPQSWASNAAMHRLLQKESGGIVGRPNYTYGRSSKNPGRWASVHNDLKKGIKRTKSSATGLGQFILANVDKYYPNGRAGIGDPNNEMIGMLRYIKDRYGSPERALAFHLRKNWY